MTALGIDTVQRIREGTCDRDDLISALRILAICARELAAAAEGFAEDIEKPEPKTDRALLATMKRVAQIGGTVDVRA
jgi:hypothetical protein